MKNFLLVMVGLFCVSAASAAEYDFLAKQTLTVQGSEPRRTLDDTAADLRAVFEKYEPALDSGTRIVRPLRISGSQREPNLNIILEKCVIFICKTVELDAVVSVAETNGKCESNMVMSVNLNKSSQDLTDVYDQIDVNICLNGRNLDMDAHARRADRYSSGPVQQEIFKLLRLQIKPIVTAVDETLKEKAR